ncbi:hypothetical protein pb186bvf_011326 [Paramecium bursaria]
MMDPLLKYLCFNIQRFQQAQDQIIIIMNQQVQLNNPADQFEQDYQFLQNRRLIRLATLFGPEGLLYYDEDDRLICKLFNLNQYNYDQIGDLGIFKDQIECYQKQLRIHKNSINNFGVIQYVHQGQLPLFYCHADWNFTLYNCLKKLQLTGQQMNQDTVNWIAKQLAYIINLQHENSFFQLNTSIENIVFKQYFNFRFIRFQLELEGQQVKFYRFIIRNFIQNHQQFLIENQNEATLRQIIQRSFSSNEDIQFILNFNPDIEPNRKSQVQIFLYQLSLYAGSFNYSIYNIDFNTLVRHHTIQITNFECAVRRDPQLENQQLTVLNQNILINYQKHPNIENQQIGLQQQDYYTLGIVLGQIYMANNPNNQIKIQTQTGNSINGGILQAFLPNNFIGNLSRLIIQDCQIKILMLNKKIFYLRGNSFLAIMILFKNQLKVSSSFKIIFILNVSDIYGIYRFSFKLRKIERNYR